MISIINPSQLHTFLDFERERKLAYYLYNVFSADYGVIPDHVRRTRHTLECADVGIAEEYIKNVRSMDQPKKYYDFWHTMYDGMYEHEMLESCITKIKERCSLSIKRHILTYNGAESYDRMMMIVNEFVDEPKVCEHIFIHRLPTTIIRRPPNHRSLMNAEAMHKFAMNTFKPTYIVSNPVEFMTCVFDKMTRDKIISKNITNITNIIQRLGEDVCRNVTAVYTITDPSPQSQHAVATGDNIADPIICDDDDPPAPPHQDGTKRHPLLIV